MARSKSHSADSDLFPETLGANVEAPEYKSTGCLDHWGGARITVRLIPRWFADEGIWKVGWFCNVDRAVDEWMPGKATPNGWPWYRPSEIASAGTFALACGTAARAVKIVLKQMLEYTDSPEVKEWASRIETQLEVQARDWFLSADNA